MLVTTQYGCCLNTILSASIAIRYKIVCLIFYLLMLYSDDVGDQIEYAVNTGDIYDLCGIESGEFCIDVN